MLTMRASYGGLARNLLHTHQWAYFSGWPAGLYSCPCSVPPPPVHTTHRLGRDPSYCASTHFRMKKRPNQLYRDLGFHGFKLFSEKAKTCKVSFGFVDHFFSFLPFFLLFPLKDRQVFFKITAHLLSWKIKEEAVRNFELNGKNIFGKF